ncbi:MAG: pyridoxal-phosphate dependent enzyme [Deltaproteobacteria bacterium]|nr:pyridoxal-phosphate dependent enzyme [Deltaproteobacteria bacterium]
MDEAARALTRPPEALLQRLPRLADEVPWLPLGAWPTPVERLLRLGAELGLELWVKREDRCGPAYGGNKVRNLEPLLAQALRRGCRSVVVVGGVGSNQVVATAYYARELGLAAHAVVVPQPVTPNVARNVSRAAALGATIWPCPSSVLLPLTLLRAWRGAERPFLIGPGGSSVRGSLGTVAAGLELGAQVARGELPPPSRIYLPLGSSGTAAGLLVGLGLAGLRPELVAVAVVHRLLANGLRTRRLARALGREARRLGGEVPRRLPSLTVLHGFYGGGYGRVTPAGLDAQRQLLELEGLTLDTTYGAKAMAALLGHARSGALHGPVLFWHTYDGRTPALPSNLPEEKARSLLPPRVQAWLAAGPARE